MERGVVFAIVFIAVINLALAGCTLPKKEEKEVVKEQEKTILLEPTVKKVSIEEEEVKADPLSASENDKIILSGRWFFSAHNMDEGHIDYYDKHANYLGRKTVSK